MTVKVAGWMVWCKDISIRMEVETMFGNSLTKGAQRKILLLKPCCFKAMEP